MTEAAYAPPTPAGDARRVSALRRLDVLDQPRRPDLDSLARLAAYICGTEMAAINLIDADRQWSAAASGCEPAEVRRCDSLCATAINTRDVSYTPDASTDARWRSSPFVNGQRAGVRLYAAAPLILPGGDVIGTVCAFGEQSHELTRVQLERLRDIADQAVWLLELGKRATSLEYAATRDSLTGLPNRSLFFESLHRAMAKHLRGESTCAVVFADLNGFKAVNDQWGHQAGDELLRAIGQRLAAAVRATDLLARLAGDEFVVLLEAPTAAAVRVGSERLATRIEQALSSPFVVGGTSAHIGLALGTAYAEELPPDFMAEFAGNLGEACAALLAKADAAMYRDKRTWRTMADSAR